jgi:putative chitobiose transport system substrate-binding protein
MHTTGARFLSVLCLLAVLISGCGSADHADESDVLELEFWTIALGDAFGDYINGMIAQYEAENSGVKVKWVDVSGGEVAEKFIASLVAGDPPDVANIYDLPRFLEHDVLSNLDELVSPEEKDKRIEAFWHGMGWYQGANYVLPWYSGVDMLWYNKEIFAAAGLDPERPPKTMQEMFEFGRVIHEQTGKYGVSWRLHPSLNAPPWVILRLENVWPLFDETYSHTTINRPEALAVFESWIDAYQHGVRRRKLSLLRTATT